MTLNTRHPFSPLHGYTLLTIDAHRDIPIATVHYATHYSSHDGMLLEVFIYFWHDLPFRDEKIVFIISKRSFHSNTPR